MLPKKLEKRRRVMQRSIKLGHCICNPKLGCPCDLFREKDVCLCAGERLQPDNRPVKLTQLVEKTGCASKIDQATLRRVLGGITAPADPRVLIGAPAGDDAGVFMAAAGQAWVQTVDVFSPCVDDPYLFGQIAAANSVSDVYAMGGTPLTALSIIAFPAGELPDAIMSEIIRGGVDKMAEAGVAVIGGHSINDPNIKAGFAVTGLVDPRRILSNAAAQPGDALVLTKPLGTGILSFAAQIDRVPGVHRDTGDSSANNPIESIAQSMAALNRTAAELMVGSSAHACTDVTGFGLIGHLAAMASAGGVDVEITWDDVPLFPGVLECVAVGIVPGAIERNRESSQEAVDAGDGVTAAMLDILFDAQTSGGLLIAIPEADAEELVGQLQKAGVCAAAVIGRVLGAGGGRILVRTSHKRSAPEAIAVAEDADAHRGSTTTRTSSLEKEAAMSECCGHQGSATDAPGTPAAGIADQPGAPAVSEAQKRFQAFLQTVNQPGALDAHTKQAISIALSVLAKCEPCVRAHVKKAREKGFTEEEIDEAAWMAISFRGAPLMMFYQGVRGTMEG